MRSYVKWVYFSTHWNHRQQRRHLRNGNSIEQRYEDRTQLLRTFYPRPFTHFPWQAWLFLQPSASSDQKGWVTACLFIKGPQETSLPRTPPATYLSNTDLKGCTLQTPHCCWLPGRPHQAHLLSQRKSTGKNASSVHLPSTFTPGRVLRKQTGKSSMHLVQRKQ